MEAFSFFVMHVFVLAYALVSGVFLAFSDFIMRSLAGTSGHGGVEAMQTINREVFRWAFMTLFLGMSAGSLALVIYGAIMIEGFAGLLMIASGVMYLLGCFGVTVVFNVPMNEALSGMESGSENTQTYWTSVYLPRWTFWNTVRTVASTLSACLLLLALYWIDQS